MAVIAALSDCNPPNQFFLFGLEFFILECTGGWIDLSNKRWPYVVCRRAVHQLTSKKQKQRPFVELHVILTTSCTSILKKHTELHVSFVSLSFDLFLFSITSSLCQAKIWVPQFPSGCHNCAPISQYLSFLHLSISTLASYTSQMLMVR